MFSEKTFQDLKNAVAEDGISICQFLNRYYSKLSQYLPLTSIHVENVDHLLHACQILEVPDVKIIDKTCNVVTSTKAGSGIGPLAEFLNTTLFEPYALKEKLNLMTETELTANLWCEIKPVETVQNDFSSFPDPEEITKMIKERFTILKEKNYPMFPTIMDLLIAKWLKTGEVTPEEAKQMERFVLVNCFLPPSRIASLQNPNTAEQIHTYFTQDLSLNIGVLEAGASIPLIMQKPSLLAWNKWAVSASGESAKKMKHWMTIDYRSALFRLSQLQEMKKKVGGLVIGYTLPHLFTRLTPYLTCIKFGHLTKNNPTVTAMFASVISEIFRRRVIVLSSTNVSVFHSAGPYLGSSGGYSGSVMVDFSSPALDDSVASQVDYNLADTSFTFPHTSEQYSLILKSKHSDPFWLATATGALSEESMEAKVLRLLRLMYQSNPLAPDSCIVGDYLMGFPSTEHINKIQYAYAEPYLHCSPSSEIYRSCCMNNTFVIQNAFARILKSHIVKFIDTDPNCFKRQKGVTSLVTGCFPYIFFSHAAFSSSNNLAKGVPLWINFQQEGLLDCCKSTYQKSTKAAFFLTTSLNYSWCEQHKDEVEKIKTELKSIITKILIQPQYIGQAKKRFEIEVMSSSQLHNAYEHDHAVRIAANTHPTDRKWYPKGNGTVVFMIVIPNEQLTNFLCESYLYYSEHVEEDMIVPTLGYDDSQRNAIIGWEPKALKHPNTSKKEEQSKPLISLQKLECTPEVYKECNKVIDKEYLVETIRG